MTNVGRRRALVTGSARGLGAAIVERLARDGCSVVAADRRAPLGRSQAERLRADGCDVTFVELDVTSEEGWQGLATELGAADGLDILVNNAGSVRMEQLAEETDEGFEQVVSIILTGAFLGMRAMLPLLRERHGVIVNVTSTAAHQAVPAAAAYHAAKGGLRALSRAAAVELAPDVRVNCVVPGSMHTPMIDEIPGLRDAQRGAAAASPLKRLLTVEEVAACVAFLASTRSAYIVGADLVADGGCLAS